MDGYAGIADYAETVFSSRFCIYDSADLVEAVQRACEIFRDAARLANLPPWPIVKIEIEEWERWVREERP